MMKYFTNKLNQKIAYKYSKGKSPGLIFIHGLKSDMEGLKAQSIGKFAKKNGLSYLRFDCRGHGKSHGKFEDFTISDWKKDLIDIIDNLTKGPQILIGSSMGGWLMMLAVKARKKRIFGLIGLAAALDFGKDLHESLSLKSKKELKKNGFTKYSKNNFSYILRKKFFSEAKKNNLLNKKIIFNKPVILIHGFKDDVVNYDMPQKIMNSCTGKNLEIRYSKYGDHRLSKNNDLKNINNAIESILSGH